MGFKDECGVIGVYGHPHAARVTAEGLFALQHRGQEAAGIMTLSRLHKRPGLVRDVFTETTLSHLEGDMAIGHVRYSTAGGNNPKNAQPFLTDSKFGKIGLAHNGNLTNDAKLRETLKKRGVVTGSTSDSETILQLIATSSSNTLAQAINSALKKLEGAFSLLILTQEGIFAARDPQGFRPLMLGEALGPNEKTFTIFASETCAFGTTRASFIGEVESGEVMFLNRDGVHRSFYTKPVQESFCIFELVYFSRPDSSMDNKSMYRRRHRAGELLANEHPANADIIVPVPDSGIPAALGFAKASDLPFIPALVRNHYIGRTFIEPSQATRGNNVRLKLNPIADQLTGQRVVLVDDSIVRGTTSRKIVRMVRAAGAQEVHIRIACPPTVSPCFYGIDTPTKSQLIAANLSISEICRFVEADSLGYLSLASLKSACGKERGYCSSCFTGKYPTPVEHLNIL